MITLNDAPDPGFKSTLEQGLADYNESQTHVRDARTLAVVLTDPATGRIPQRSPCSLRFQPVREFFRKAPQMAFQVRDGRQVDRECRFGTARFRFVFRSDPTSILTPGAAHQTGSVLTQPPYRVAIAQRL